MSPALAEAYERAPLLVIWEVTRACALACVHCRADTIPRRDPRELTTQEGFRLIEQVRSFGSPAPFLVLSGGDPMRRLDLAKLVRYASKQGVTVALTPSGTAEATRARLAELRDAGLTRVAVSLDGPDPDTHDSFRRVRGSYGWTMKIIDAVLDLGLPLHINSTISRRTLPTLEDLARRVGEFPVSLWAVSFLVRTGRGAALDEINAYECERVLDFLYDLTKRAPFRIKTTEAPHYRRVVWQRTSAEGSRLEKEACSTPGPSAPSSPRAVNDGNGLVFVDHIGNISPSRFLPVSRGSVRNGGLVSTYRGDKLFRVLRDPDALLGRCGRCRFRTVCGGSRSRAWAATGAILASDPLCAYEPGPHVEAPVDV